MLQNVANIIILISAVIIAVKNIYAFIKKPVKDISNKVNEKTEQYIEEVIQKKMPVLLAEHGKNVAGQRKLEDQQRDATIKKDIIDAVENRIEELKNINLQQNDDVINIYTVLSQLKDAELNTIRYNLDNIYKQYLPYKKIPMVEKQVFITMYGVYKQMGGNGWIEAIYNEIMTWEVTDDNIE